MSETAFHPPVDNLKGQYGPHGNYCYQFTGQVHMSNMSSFHLQNPGTLSRSGLGLELQTRYTKMLIEVDRIPLIHTVLAAFFQWLLLAGYLVVPGTFTSLESSNTLNHSSSVVIRTIQNPPLVAISCVFLVIGASGMSWLAWIRRNNYIWLGKLFR
jgi:hypothetical protein